MNLNECQDTNSSLNNDGFLKEIIQLNKVFCSESSSSKVSFVKFEKPCVLGIQGSYSRAPYHFIISINSKSFLH